ncbi:MAG TPA: hypothetical protein VGI71_09635 [Scandinavium sp.]|jgi:hypothetical protein
MPEDFYAALMMRRALPATTDIKTITAAGIYPVDAGNETAPDSVAGTLIVYLPTTAPKLFFVSTNGDTFRLTAPGWQVLGTIKSINGESPNASGEITISATDVGAVPTSGGNVAYLDNSSHYRIKPGTWDGSGALSNQYDNSAAPFCIPYGYVSPKDVSVYLPIVKGLSSTETVGFGSAVSLGILRSGKSDFGNMMLHFIGDNGATAALYMDINSNVTVAGQVIPGNMTNFDSRYPRADWISYVGIVSSNENDPYMRASGSGNLIHLATKNDVNAKANPNTAAWNGALMWWRCGSTGAMRMSATIGNVGEGARITFPQAFPNICTAVVANQNSASGGGTAMTPYNVDQTGFNLHIAGGGTVTLMYIAEGW